MSLIWIRTAKIAGPLLLLALTLGGAFYSGKLHERAAQAEAALVAEGVRNEALEKAREDIQRLERRLQQAAREREQARRAGHEQARRELDAEIVDRTECGLTDGELRAYENLLRSTRRSVP